MELEDEKEKEIISGGVGFEVLTEPPETISDWRFGKILM